MAQIVTITNPLTGQPAQVDQLDHTAQQIDDAIARALPGGGIDTLLAGKAPAGYGLGEKQGKRLSTTDDLNSITTSGWYWWPDMPSNAPISNACMLVYSAYDGDCIVQEIHTYLPSGYSWDFGGSVILRQIYTTFIGEWEWVNPPMKLGKEYRTTERRNGLPVYTQFKNLGKIVNGAYGDISVTNLDSVVGYEAFWVNRPLPIIKNSSLTDAETQYLNVYVLNTNTIRVYYYGGTSVSGNGDVYVLVKYTKST